VDEDEVRKGLQAMKLMDFLKSGGDASKLKMGEPAGAKKDLGEHKVGSSPWLPPSDVAPLAPQFRTSACAPPLGLTPPFLVRCTSSGRRSPSFSPRTPSRLGRSPTDPSTVRPRSLGPNLAHGPDL